MDGLLPAEATSLGDGDGDEEDAGAEGREGCWPLHDRSPASRRVETNAGATRAARTVAAEAMPEAINATADSRAASR